LCSTCISNKGLLKEYDKEENVEVTGAATTSCIKKSFETFCPKSRTRKFTAQ